MNQIAEYIIKVTWFKPYGKYYAEGQFITSKEHMHEVFNDFEEMLNEGIRPGLVNGSRSYYAVLDCSNHPNGYPALFPIKD